MQYVSFGNSGVKVSRVALGLGFRGQADPVAAERVIRKAMDLGINLIDCGNIYSLLGEEGGMLSEQILGNAIRGRREDVVITSKVGSILRKKDGPNKYGASRYHVMYEIENSLRRLNTDRIDVYLLHDPDPTTPFEEQFRTMETLVQQGKIRYVGLCNHKAWETAMALAVQQRINAQPIITVQNAYSLLNRTLEDEMFPLVRHTGLGIMAFSVLGLGLLSGAYVPGSVPENQRFWSRHPLFRSNYDQIFKGRVVEVAKAVKDLAEKHCATMSQVAVAWVLSKREVSVAISGANQESQIEDTLGSLDVSLSEEDLSRLDQVSAGLRISLMNYDLPKEASPKA